MWWADLISLNKIPIAEVSAVLCQQFFFTKKKIYPENILMENILGVCPQHNFGPEK